MKSQPITFIVPGQAQPFEATPATGKTRGAAAAPREGRDHRSHPQLPAGLRQGILKHSVRVSAQRGGAGEVRVTAVPGEDVVVLHIANGPSLMLHPETARDLMLAQGKAKRSRSATGKEEPGPNEVKVPAQLQWQGLEQAVPTRGVTRGFLGDVLLQAVDVITGLGKDKVVDFAASKFVKAVDAQVEEGVYALHPETLPRLKGNAKPLAKLPASNSGPLLVLVHGTFSNTNGTFAKLWTEHPQRVRVLFNHYHNQVYALDHQTLGKSPIQNALTLAEALPKGARLHLVTHSRGGLVAEVLARVCGIAKLTRDDLEPFEGKGYETQLRALKKLFKRVKERGIKVERIVRVACPARGTLLASKRLDAYVSVFKWTLELAGIPVAPALLDFLGEVAQRRADPEMLPGLAAQIPDSPLVQWLHAVEEPVESDLRVIAGDMEGDSVTSWLKTLLADAFYWTDNDLVVQTRSMYGGAPRARGASFVLDQGGKVSHFNYFSNERTAEAIVNALVQEMPPGFRVIGPLSWAGESSTGTRAALRGTDSGSSAGNRPAVFVIPGILGSNLKVNGKRIWLGWRVINGLKRLTYLSNPPDQVEPDGPIGMFYNDLADFLSNTHEVFEFGFDWRRPIEEEARRLATEVEAALDAREKSNQPVCIIAHSMGGLVARTLQMERPEIWHRMMLRPGGRILMLGTPNGGSWAPMQVLSGDDTFGNTLVAVGAPFQDHAARELMAQFPGFIQLQASLLDEKLALAHHETWKRLAEEDLKRIREQSWWHSVAIQLNAYRWGVPSQDVLNRAVALRKRLDAQGENDLGTFRDKLLLVVGNARFTPDGYEIGNEGLVYLDAPEDGDGRVTLHSALLPGVRTWTLDCGHGSLPSKRDAFRAYLELLQNGNTNLLTPLPAVTTSRGVAAITSAHVRSRPSRTRQLGRPPESKSELYSIDSQPSLPGPIARGTALRITVVNGDLTFIRQPLMIGHYRSMRLTGTERVMNRLIGGAMEDSLQVNLYPDPPGTHQVFVNSQVDSNNPWRLPRPEAVIVAGLGEEGKLDSASLVHTVRQAVIAWAQRMAEKPDETPAVFELAATLIGSGGTGITVGQSAQLIAQGVREANELLDGDHRIEERPIDRKWPRVSHLHLVELYLDRATEAWRALQMQAAAGAGQFLVTETVQPGTGALRRPLDSGYRGADYDFITALTGEGQHGNTLISYTLDTKRARTEVRAQATQGPLMRELVASASNDANNDTRIGRTLFQLLVPVEMEPFLGGTTEMVLEIDSGTAGIPWELLDTNTGAGRDARPWAVRAKLLRKLRTTEFRAQVADANADSSILVIGEPECDSTIYPRLPGARKEARAVASRLTGPGALEADKVKALISPEDSEKVGADARTVLNALLERDWRIVHIAGHGEPPEKLGPVPINAGDPPQKDGDPRGVVLSKRTFLGPREIHNMRVVPELVFVNCCHLAARNTDQLLRASHDRVRFAAGVAEELIKIGVRCVIAAGWAVEDGAACAFATTFYDALLRGHRFIDAVAEAREAALTFGGNTWAAYQCYGDPDWRFRREVADAQRPVTPLAEEFAGVASSEALRRTLETLAVQSKFQNAPAEKQQARLRHLEARFASLWGNIGEVAEAFGAAWSEAGNQTHAMTWYEKALGANDSTTSLKAAEQLGDLKAHRAWEAVDQALKHLDELNRQPAKLIRGQSPARIKAREMARDEIASAKRKLNKAIGKGRKGLNEAMTLLEKLVALHPSMERESLCGSAYKHRALLEAAAGRRREEARAIEKMKQHYERAEALGQEGQLSGFFNPALNRIAAELVIKAGRRGWKGLEPAAIAAVRQNLATKVRDDPDFWSWAGQTELSLYEALARGVLAKARNRLTIEYEDLHERVSAINLWSSVRDRLRFVLSKYSAHASTRERKAAAALLKLLEGWAAARKPS